MERGKATKKELIARLEELEERNRLLEKSLAEKDGIQEEARQAEEVAPAADGIETDSTRPDITAISNSSAGSETETALRQSEARYRFLTDSLSDILWTVDLGFKTTYVSPSVEKTLGFTVEERLRQDVSEQLTPRSLELAKEELARDLDRIIRDPAEIDSSVTLTLDYYHKNGAIVTMETIMRFILDENMNPVGIHGLSRDVTERVKAEQALRDSERRLSEIIDFLPDATLAIDGESRVVAWNKAMEKMSGVPAEEMLGQGDYGYAVPFYDKPRPMLADLALSPDEEIEKLYLSFPRENDLLVSESFNPDIKPGGAYLRSTASPLYDSQGQVVGAIQSIRDITRLKRTEEAWREAIDRAESATRATSEFIANMSHEIRTPLNAALGAAELLLDTDPTDQQMRRIRVIEASSEAIVALLNDILDLSKIKAGKFELADVDFSLQEAIDGVIALVEDHARHKGLYVRSEIHEDAPAHLRGDPNRLRQILLNLVNNAVKFTNKGGITVHVKLSERHEDTVSLDFAVSDTGIGIPREKQASIFDRYIQADSTLGDMRGGSGLGLAIARQLVAAMGGEIRVESEQGRGSVFHFTARFEPGEAPEAPVRRLEIDAAQTAGRAIWKVLLAEDNELNQVVVSEQLCKLGCEVVVAGNGRETVERFSEEDFDLILMDLQMPEIDGYAAARLIRRSERGAKVPIIALTAHALLEEREKCLTVGMDDHIPKPVSGAGLRLLMRKYLPQKEIQPAWGEPRPHSRNLPVESPEESGFNQDELLDRLDGDQEAAEELVHIFIDYFPSLAHTLTVALQDKDPEKIARTAHTMKGACASVGATALRDTAYAIELAGKVGNAAAAESLLTDLERRLEAFKRAAERFVKG